MLIHALLTKLSANIASFCLSLYTNVYSQSIKHKNNQTHSILSALFTLKIILVVFLSNSVGTIYSFCEIMNHALCNILLIMNFVTVHTYCDTQISTKKIDFLCRISLHFFTFESPSICKSEMTPPINDLHND